MPDADGTAGVARALAVAPVLLGPKGVVPLQSAKDFFGVPAAVTREDVGFTDGRVTDSEPAVGLDLRDNMSSRSPPKMN